MPTGVYVHRRTPLLERFWTRVDKSPDPDGCWLWTGTVSTKGYGTITSGGRHGRHIAAHRLSWEIHRGAILAGLEVCHNCPGGDNPLCVNPAHLFLGTHLENFQDAQRKERLATGDRHGMRLHPERIPSLLYPERMPRGEQNSGHKVTTADVRAMRARYTGGGVSQRQLASEYGISQAAVCKILLRQHWRHIE